jgi:hypothetical protein
VPSNTCESESETLFVRRCRDGDGAALVENDATMQLRPVGGTGVTIRTRRFRPVGRGTLVGPQRAITHRTCPAITGNRASALDTLQEALIRPWRAVANSVVDQLTVDEVLMRLPPRYRADLVLRDVRDHRYEEIAEILDIPLTRSGVVFPGRRYGNSAIDLRGDR